MNEFIERISKLSPKRLVLLAAELQSRLQAAEEAAAQAATGAASGFQTPGSQSPGPQRPADPDEHAIAVVGMGLRFPGGAESPEEFWDFLCRSGDGIGKVPASRWDVDALYDPDPETPGTMASLWGGFVDGIDEFDPQFFGITPREASSMDPQQRMTLEASWQALERAGYAPDQLAGSATGVFIGACNGDYYHMVLQSGDENLEMYTATGSAHSVISGRISYLLGLQGPSLTVDTACSSSLVALHLACQSLRNGECDMALAGGVNAILAPDTTVVLSKAKMMAPDGRCKAFDARADGFVRSEGCGVVVLKRLADALAGGDQILAVVRGSAINQDGHSNGLTAPNGPSQVSVLRNALADAGVEPAAISYIETHGTGTSLGDPIEVQALAEALGPGRPADQPLLIGSVKTNLGHLESAAGVAGFIKLVLTLQHRAIPPHLHLQELNPYIAWDELPVRVPKDGADLPAVGGRRLGGVSSFGFSGTNVHMVLEAAPEPAPARGRAGYAAGGQEDGQEDGQEAGGAADRPMHLLQLTARSASALQTQARNFAGYLAANEADFADVAFTANTGRALFTHRLALTASTRAEAQEKLADFAAHVPGTSDVPGTFYGHVPGNRKPAVAFLFSGHGGQYAGMGEALYATQPAFRSAFDQCDALFRPFLSTSLAAMFEPVAPGAPTRWMESMTFAQPALFSLQYALAQMWRSWGIEPHAVAGHSIGEYAAACVAGVLRLEDAVKLVEARSRLMDAIPATGAMVAVFAEEAQVAAAVAPYAKEVAIAAINGPQAIVISGVAEAVQEVAANLATAKVRSRRLAVAQGAHSPLIDTVLDEFAAVAAAIEYADPQITFVSSLFGRAVHDGEISNAGYWRRHLREPVRFADAVHALHEGGNDAFVEIGPSPMLIAMAQRCLPDGAAGVFAPSLRPAADGRAATDRAATDRAGDASSAPAAEREWQVLLDSVAALSVYGVDFDWAAFDRPYPRRRLPLPTYPFERGRFWFAQGRQSAPRGETRSSMQRRTGAPAHPLLGTRLRSPALQDIVFESEIGRYEPAFLDHHSIFGAVILPSPAYLEMALSAVQQLGFQESYALVNFTIHAPLLLPEEGTRTVQLLLKQPGSGGALGFQVLAWDGAAEEWKLHATGDLVPAAAANGGLAESVAVPQETFDVAALRQRCAHEVTGAAYYEQVRHLGLHFGDSFQGIRHVWIGEGEALGQIVLPPSLVEEAQQYRFHPAMLDACFHLLGAPLAKDGMDAAYLLIGIERFQLHRLPGPELWNHTRIVQAPSGALAGVGSETFTGDIELYNGAGELVAEAHGLQLKRADRATLLRAVGQRPMDWLYEVEWQLQPPSAVRELQDAGKPAAAAGAWLIAGSDNTTAQELDRMLAGRGIRSVLVEHGAAADIPYLLAERGLSAPHRIVYLAAGAAEGSEAQMTSELLHLAQAAAQLPQAPAGGLWLVTRDAQPVMGPPTLEGIRQAPLWGLGRVVALEQPQIWGGMLDLDLQDPRATAQAILAELDSVEVDSADPGARGEDQIALRGGRRYVARLVRTTRKPRAGNPKLRPGAAYLVTGGLGGLGLEVARWLAERGAGHLVLMGRRGLPPREQWPQLGQDTAQDGVWSRQVRVIQDIERQGAVVTVVAADVADASGMAALFDRFGVDLPPLAGIVHTAADLSSAPVVDLTDAQVESMLRPKVQGSLNLHHLSAQRDLDFMVLFSSTTALIGASGLAHYAAANAWLDSFAHYRRSLGLPALSINWGTWSIMRAASGAEQQRVAEFGLEQMPAEQALELMGELLLEPQGAQVAVAAVNWAALKPAYEARRHRPLLALLGAAPATTGRTSPQQSLNGAGEKGAAADTPALLAAYREAQPDDRWELLVSALRAAVAKIVGMTDPAAIDIHQGLFEMGMDSLMSVELKTRLERQVGAALPSTLTFNYPTIFDLAGYLEKQVLLVEDAAPLPAARAAAPDVVDTREIDELSEDELAAQLMQRLHQLR